MTNVQRQYPTAHSHAQRAISWGRRLAWLGLGPFALAFAVLEIVNHGWVALVAVLGLLLAPDLTMLVGAKRELARGQLAPAAVPFYNAAHRVWGPLALLVAAFWLPPAAPFAGGLAWLAHIGIDRGLGFGLRTREGFQRG